MTFSSNAARARAQSILESLQGGSAWTDIARAVFDLEALSAADDYGVAWETHVLNRLTEAEKPIALQQLRKMKRCYNFLLNVGRTPEEFSARPLAGIEVAIKVHTLSREKGEEELDALLAGRTYSQLLANYKAMVEEPRDHSAAQALSPKDLRAKSLRSLQAWIERQPQEILGFDLKGIVWMKRPVGSYRTVDLCYQASTESGEQKTFGFSVHRVQGHTTKAMQGIITEVALTASFYDVLWLVLFDSRKGKEFAAELDLLGIDNVGVLGWNAQWVLFERYPEGVPRPDRRMLLRFE